MWKRQVGQETHKIMPVPMILEILKVMQEDDSTITLTRNGEAVGVMMTPDRYEALFETIEILADRQVMAALEASAKDFKEGRVVSEKEVWGQ